MLEIFKPKVYQALSLPLNKLLIVDVEGCGLSIRYDPNTPLYMVCIAKVDEQGSGSVERFRNTSQAIAFIERHLAEGYVMVGHNSKFDYGALKCRGLNHYIVPGQLSVACTQIMAYIVDTNQDSLSLDALTGLKSDVLAECHKLGLALDCKSAREFWNTDWINNEPVLQVVENYCVQDLRATFSLYRRLVRWYNRNPKYIAPLLAIEFPMMEVLTHAEIAGAYVDREALDKLTYDLTIELKKANEEIKARYPGLPKLQWNKDSESYEAFVINYKKRFKGEPDDSPFRYNTHKSYIANYMDNSGIVIASDPYLLGEHCPLLPYNANAATGHNWWVISQEVPELLEHADDTKTGKPKLNKDFFADISEQLPPHLPIAKVLKLSKCLSTSKSIGEHVPADGRVHCSFNHTLTRTTRLSSSQPNTQNMSRPSGTNDEHDYGARFRKLFAAPPGKRILVADLNSF
jgi:DNA polymerase I-like protein with 3'-5' exonuclease and polymerase domains